MKYFLAFLLTATLLPYVAKADVLPDNVHSITNCIGVENIAEYPEYDFVWAITGFQNIEYSKKITDSEPACNASGTYTLFVIQKTNLDKVQYNTSDPTNENGNPGEQWIQDPKNAGLFIASNYRITFPGYVPNSDSAVKQTFTVHVDSVSPKNVVAHTASTLALDEKGTEKPSTTTEPKKEPLSPTAKVLIAIGIIGLGFAVYAWKKK